MMLRLLVLFFFVRASNSRDESNYNIFQPKWYFNFQKLQNF